MEEEIKKIEYKDIYELEKACIRLTTDLKERGMYKGFKDTLTKLYTKSGHFIFELIQNAEDCDAEEILFDLNKDELVFQHNGQKLFTLENVDAITNVGNSTKNDNGNSIGKFGVGFKSVFEYTNTPEVHSGEYHFIIKDMYIPHPIENKEFCPYTIFHLPFDISGKPKEDCFREIGETLKNLNPETLLFLTHIKKIVCRINSEEWVLQRKNTQTLMGPKNLCTLSKLKSGSAISSNTNYVRFFDKIKILISEKDESDKIHEYEKEIEVGIAFKAQLTDKSGWSINPIIYNEKPAGKVFTFFPCEAEKSGLCFHIHAPFALTVDREKLRNDPGNESIKNKIVDLLHSSLNNLKEDNLLNMDFLKTLPNNEDDLGTNNSSNYEMFKKIFEAFDNEPFTPMENGTFEPAKGKLRSKNRIGSLFSDEDMNRLYGTEKVAYWIKNPRQLNQRDDKFILSLSCKNYNLNNFLDDYIVEQKKYDGIQESLKNKNFVVHEGIKKSIVKFEKIFDIFTSKNADWFAKFYGQLETMISSWEASYDYDDIRCLPFCYCSDSKLYNFSQCYLPTTNLTQTQENIHFLNNKIVDEVEKNNGLKSFLKSIGLKEYSETEIFKIDFENFIKDEITYKSLIEIFNKCRKLPQGIDSFSSDYFSSYKETKFILSNDNKIYAPDEIYLDEQYGCSIKNVDLYFESLKGCNLHKISDKYLELLSSEDELFYFAKFLKNFGCKSNITILQIRCTQNRYWKQIWQNSPGYGAGRSEPTSIDFTVEGLDSFLTKPSLEKFEFVWSFLQHTPITVRTRYYYEKDASYCYYRTAQKYDLKKYSSELRNILVNSSWVAQEENGTINFVTPAKAYTEKLPENYKIQLTKTNYNLSNWFERIEFGKEEKQNEAEYQRKLEEEKKQQEELNKLSQSVGVSLDTLSEFAQAEKEGLITDEDIRSLIDNKRRAKQNREEFETNNSQTINEERVSEKAKENFDDADDISTEKRERSVRTTNSGIKESAKAKLRNRYTNSLNGNMVCQICQNPMPFKDKADNDYFVSRQLFSSKIFEKEVDENYVALCPICDAKYKVYMAQDEEKQSELKQAIINSEAEETEYDIALDDDYKLSFSKQHIISLYSCLSGVTLKSPKKAVIVVHKKLAESNFSDNLEKEAFCIRCMKAFKFITTKPVVSCPSCHSSYKNSKGVITLLNNPNQIKSTNSIVASVSFEQLRKAIEITRVESNGFVLAANLAKSLKIVIGGEIPGKMRNIISNYSDKLLITEYPALGVKIR